MQTSFPYRYLRPPVQHPVFYCVIKLEQKPKSNTCTQQGLRKGLSIFHDLLFEYRYCAVHVLPSLMTLKCCFCTQIKDGQACLGYDLGHGNISGCVPYSINDGNWHKVGLCPAH